MEFSGNGLVSNSGHQCGLMEYSPLQSLCQRWLGPGSTGFYIDFKGLNVPQVYLPICLCLNFNSRGIPARALFK
jgi:hypothetical protein